MLTQYSLGRPGSKRVMAPRPNPAPFVSPLIRRNVRFQFVETMHMHSSSWETTAKIVSGRIKETRRGDVIYRAILADQNGDKMEAVAYGLQANRFNNELRIRDVYLFKNVGFQTADMPPAFGLTIPTECYVVLHTRTDIRHVGPNISIPRLPSRFMDFIDAARLRNKMLIDVIGIVVHVSPVRFHRSFERSMPCRDVILMDITEEFIVLRIWDQHVSRHMTKWRLAERRMWTLAATLLEVSTVQGALKSIDETQIVFEPDNLRAYELASYRQTLGPARGSIRSRVRAFVRQRMKMGLYDNLRLGRL